MTYRLVIFDFDGTLADSAAWMRGVLNQVARKYRFRQLADHEFEELRGMDARAGLKFLGVSTWKLPFIAHHVRGLMAARSANIDLFDGVPKLLLDLRARRVTTAIVSSNAEANIRAILGPESAARIDHYACGAGLFGKKKKFREVLRKTGISPREAIAIGDEIRDIDAALGAGIDAGAVGWGYATRESLRARAPTVMFENFEAMRDVLLG